MGKSSVPEVSVLGLGNWGTALAHHLASKGISVLGWAIEKEIIRGINEEKRNPRYLSDAPLNSELRATGDLAEALRAPVLVVVLPAAVLVEFLPKIKAAPGTVIVSATKGLESKSLRTPLQFAKDLFGSAYNLAVISGPSFARDVVRQKPCGIVAASANEAVARQVAELFSSQAMKVYMSTDPLGVELGGITKNVIAFAAGVSDGMGMGESARAGLITRGLAEMMRLATAMGADRQTLAGLSGLGDLAMTATSDLSRNRTVGVRLGRGESLQAIIDSLGSVAEAVTSTPLILRLGEKYKVDMPITSQAAKLLRGEASPEQLAKELIARPLKREFE